MPHKSQLINHNMFESLEKLTAAVEAACADIAPSYAEYVQLAMAIATDCGEGGRADFHRICSFSPKYQSSHADRLYTNALKNGHGNVHLGTAFHLAQTAGVDIREEKRAKDTKNALDAENERVIVENLYDFYQGRTVIVVAHRLSTVKHADQIIVLDKGRIIETGNHNSLIEKRGAYYNLVKNQLELGN